MPLLVGGAVPIGPSPTAPGSPGEGFVPRQGPGSMTATWIDPDSNEWPLTVTAPDPGWFTMFGPAGWGSTPIELVTDPNPRGGELVRYIRAKPRVIQWPLYVGGDSHADFVTRYRNIMRAFAMTTYRRTPGALLIQRPDGTQRLIEAFYQEGFEGEAGENWVWAKPIVSLFCPDGYWADGEQRTLIRSLDPATQKSFTKPFITLSPSSVLDNTGAPQSTTVLNLGDVEAWPEWTLTGPFDSFEAINRTSGERFRFALTVPAGGRVVITTDPKTVRYYANVTTVTPANVSRYIDWFNTAGTSLWPLVSGQNNIDLQLSGADTTTNLQMTWRARYESA